MVLEDLGVYLEGLSLVTVGDDLILGHMPESPSLGCALLEYEGQAPLRNQSEGAARSGAQSGERPRIQLLCRAASYVAGRSLIQSIWQALDGVVNQSINGTNYVRIAAIQAPFFLEIDDNKRYLFAANFQITKAV